MSAAEKLADAGAAQVFHSDWRDLLPVAAACNALIVDAPYSQRTHSGHGTQERWGTSLPPTHDGGQRREINYQAWGDADVRAFVEAWTERVGGWMVSITDDVLAPVWRAEFERVGRMAFAPIPFVAPGSRVRLAGDGPSCWTVYIMVARPRTREMSRWGTLPGAYVLPPGFAERMKVVGGKPLWLMERLVEDYSRPGDLIVDPCCGVGTTLAAAVRTGRRAIGGDVMREHAEAAAQRLRQPQQSPLFVTGRSVA